jgi:hypothetical protein
MIKVEARNKRTGETKTFAEPVWAMLEKSGHARRNWDFVRRYSVEVPAEVALLYAAQEKAVKEIAGIVNAVDRSGREDSRTILASTGLTVKGEEVFQELHLSSPSPGVHTISSAMPPRAVDSKGNPFTMIAPEPSVHNPQNVNAGGILSFATPKQQGKKRRKKTPE